MPYTGKLGFGKDFAVCRYPTFGFSLWMYLTAFEAEVVNGRVEEIEDVSGKMAEIRANDPKLY